MPRRCRTVLYVLCLAGLVGCATHTSVPTPANTHAITYEVFGMDCPGCHGGVEKNIEKIPGVVKASANWKKQTITIQFDADAELDPAQVEKAIRDSNFTPGKRVQ